VLLLLGDPFPAQEAGLYQQMGMHAAGKLFQLLTQLNTLG